MMAHSLVRERSQLLTDLAEGKFNLTLLVNTPLCCLSRP
jgi:hypothetical protein